MYPNTAVPCELGAEYCLQQLNVVVHGNAAKYTSSWTDGRVLLVGTLAESRWVGSSVPITTARND